MPRSYISIGISIENVCHIINYGEKCKGLENIHFP